MSYYNDNKTPTLSHSTFEKLDSAGIVEIDKDKKLALVRLKIEQDRDGDDPRLLLLTKQDSGMSKRYRRFRRKKKRKSSNRRSSSSSPTSSSYATSASSGDSNSYLPVVVLNNDLSDKSDKYLKRRRLSSWESEEEEEMDGYSKSRYYDDDEYYSQRRYGTYDYPRYSYYNPGYNPYMMSQSNGMYGSYSASPQMQQMQMAATLMRMQQMAAAAQSNNRRTSLPFGLDELFDYELVVMLGAIAAAVYFLNGVITMAANGTGRRQRGRGGRAADFVTMMDNLYKGKMTKLSMSYGMYISWTLWKSQYSLDLPVVMAQHPYSVLYSMYIVQEQGLWCKWVGRGEIILDGDVSLGRTF